MKTPWEIITERVFGEYYEAPIDPPPTSWMIDGGVPMLPVPHKRNLLTDGSDRHFLYWFGHYLPLSQLEGHFLTIGKTGSAKSLLTYPALCCAAKAAVSRPDTRAVIFDTKGDVLPILDGIKVPYTLININDLRAHAWDIAKDCETADHARQLTSILIPDAATSDPFWKQGARSIAAGIIASLHTLCCHDWGLFDVYNAAQMDAETLTKFLEVTTDNQSVVNRIMRAASEKTRDGILMELGVSLNELQLAAAHQFHTPRDKWLSIREFVQTNGVLVISQDLTAREASSTIMRAMFRRLVDYLNALPDSRSRKTFVFLDECPFIGALPGLHELLTFGRSKGTHCWITGQAIEQFRALYGVHNSSAMEGSCDFKAILKVNSEETARWACGLFGQYTAYELTPARQFNSEGVSHSDSMHKVVRDHFVTADFLKLPQPSSSEGLSGYLLSSFTEGLKIHLSSEEIKEMQPPRTDIAAQLPKPSHLKRFPIWNEADLRRILQVDDSDELLELYLGDTPAPAWQKELRREVFKTLQAIVQGQLGSFYRGA